MRAPLLGVDARDETMERKSTVLCVSLTDLLWVGVKPSGDLCGAAGLRIVITGMPYESGLGMVGQIALVSSS